MLFKIKEKFWSWGNSFAILDRDEREAYTVKGKVFSWGKDLSMHDSSGAEVARIKQTLFSFKPRYQIIINGQMFAEVVKEFSWFKSKFTLDVPGPNDYTITGSFWEHEFNFERSGRTVARISKRAWSWTDSYGIDIDDGEDAVSILCACIVIDQVLHDEDDD